jgi:amino acid permease
LAGSVSRRSAIHYADICSFSVFLIINAALGAGLLNFPKSFDEAGGVVVGLVVQAVLLVFILAAVRKIHLT